jgi:hypothetical protein
VKISVCWTKILTHDAEKHKAAIACIAMDAAWIVPILIVVVMLIGLLLLWRKATGPR